MREEYSFSIYTDGLKMVWEVCCATYVFVYQNRLENEVTSK